MTSKSVARQKKRSIPKKVRKWCMVTNHLNMMYMLAAGMVMSPAGFRGKHYKDSLSIYPGLIPFFFGDKLIPFDVLELVTRERKHLIPCIATFELSDYSGPVMLLKKNGTIQHVDSQPTRKNKNDIAMLVPAPFPISKLNGIHFQSAEDEQTFVRAASAVSNVASYSHLISVSDELFESDPAAHSQAKQSSLTDSSQDSAPFFGLAVGGVLAMLYHIANQSDYGLAIFRSLTEEISKEEINKDVSEFVQEDPVLAELPNWIQGGEISEGADDRVRLFWGIVQSMVASQEKERPQNPIDVVLIYLDSQLDSLRNYDYAPKLKNLIADIRDLTGLGGKTISQLLEEHKGSLSRPLLLLCLRDHCVDLLDFSDPSLSNTEYVLAGILLGVRDSWLQLPTQLRAPELTNYVAYQMADAELRTRGNMLKIKSPPPPVPMRAFFKSEVEWDELQVDQAVQLAKECQWTDCIRSVVTLTDGDLPTSFDRNGLHLVLPGSVTVEEELDRQLFISRLGKMPFLDSVVESRIRKRLNTQQEEKVCHADDSQPTNPD